MRQTIKAALFISAAATFAIATPAAANTSKVTKEVTFNDLNLNHPAGVEALNRRIEAATKEACERNWDRSDRRAANFADIQRCIAAVREQINDQVAKKQELAVLFAEPTSGDVSQ